MIGGLIVGGLNRKTALLMTAALLALPAQAQVYKCAEGGKTVFSDKPCAVGAKPVEIRPAAGAYDVEQGTEARLRTLRDKEALAEAKSRRAAEERAQAREVSYEPKTLDRCDQLRADYDKAADLARRYRHPDNIARERAKAEQARDSSYFECGLNKRISIFE